MIALVTAVLVGLLHMSGGNRPPAISCPLSFSTLIQPGKRDAAVTWAVPTATDPEEGILTPVMALWCDAESDIKLKDKVDLNFRE